MAETANKKQYEMMVVLHPGLEIDLETPQKQIEEMIKSRGGEITSVDVWGKRKLAYPIKKSDYGIYVFHRLDLPAAELQKLTDELNIKTEILRYLIVEFDPALEEQKQKQAERAARMSDSDDKGDSDNQGKDGDKDSSKEG